MKLRVAMTGATGFVGSHLKKYLEAQQWALLELTRHDSVESMTEKLSSFQPDIVVHLATCFVAEHAATHLDKLVDANILFGLKLLQAMKESGCHKIINAGTNWQNWNGEYGTPASLYAATKNAFGELLRYFVSAEGFQVYHLKLCDTYGPDDRRGKLISKLLQLAKTGDSIELSPGEQLIDLTHINDVVRAFGQACQALQADSRTEGFIESFVVSSGVKNSLRSVVHLIEEVSGRKIKAHFGGRPYRQREVMKPVELDPPLPGWTARVSLKEGLQELWNEL